MYDVSDRHTMERTIIELKKENIELKKQIAFYQEKCKTFNIELGGE